MTNWLIFLSTQKYPFREHVWEDVPGNVMFLGFRGVDEEGREMLAV